MTTLKNEIAINASIEKVWSILSDLAALGQYDPTVLRSELIPTENSGVSAKRKVFMKDGKNWFEEKVTIWQPGSALQFQLTNCTFPIQSLKHSYSFSSNGSQTVVQQVMEYKVKFGLIGKLMDRMMIRKQSDKGVKLFMNGLKNHVETT